MCYINYIDRPVHVISIIILYTYYCRYIGSHAHTHLHAHIHMHAHVHTHAQTRTHTHTYVHMFMHMHARTHARTHTHFKIPTFIDTQNLTPILRHKTYLRTH